MKDPAGTTAGDGQLRARGEAGPLETSRAVTAVPAGRGGDAWVRPALLGAFAVGLVASITLSQLALTGLTLRWLYRTATGRARAGVPGPLLIALGALAATTLAAALASARPLESVMASKSLLLAAALVVTPDALEDAPGAARFLGGLLWLTAVISAVAVLQVALCPWLPAVASLGRVAARCDRAHAFFSIYMTLAGVLSLVLLAVLPGILHGLPTRRRAVTGIAAWARGAAWLLGAAALALTQVRGAWVGFAVGLAVVAGLLPRGRRLLVAGAVGLALGLLLVPAVRHRVESLGDPADPTARDRIAMWQSGVAMARDHPVLGIGPGQVKHLYPAYVVPGALRTSRGHLHDTPLQILVERGAPGFVAWVALFAVFFRAASGALAAAPPGSAASHQAAGSVAAVAGFLVGGLTEYNFGDSEVALVAYVVMALPFVMTARTAPSPPGSGGSTP